MKHQGVWAVVYAAGYGRRFGGYKQFEHLANERIVDRCVRVVRAACEGVVVVLPPEFTWDGSPVERAVAGGETNPASVRAGVDAVPAAAEIIVLHSASHPLVTVDLVQSVVDAVRQGDVDGALPADPIHDTIERVDERGIIVGTIPKEHVRLTQSPMAFRATVLRRALELGSAGTDALAIGQAAGAVFACVPGLPFNLHVTSRLELEIARRLAPLADAAIDERDR